jgi:hypothetical protein
MALRLGLIKLNCVIGEVLTPLNCSDVSADNSYKVFTRKIQNLRMSVLVDSKHLSESFFMGWFINVPEGAEL